MKTGIKYYLAAYNLVAFVFWALYLLRFIMEGPEPDSTGLLLLNIAQGLAMLEIIHSLLSWVKSPVLSTTAQVSSRILVLILINRYVFYFTGKAFVTWIGICDLSFNSKSELVFYWGLILVSIAWSITELVRYSFYFLSLFNRQPKWLLWMRYTLFIGLYPIGVTGEWLIFIAPIWKLPFVVNAYTGLVVFLLIAYGYYFPVLYKYMWKQRKTRMPN